MTIRHGRRVDFLVENQAWGNKTLHTSEFPKSRSYNIHVTQQIGGLMSEMRFQRSGNPHAPYCGKVIGFAKDSRGISYGTIDVKENPDIDFKTLPFFEIGIRGEGTLSDFQPGDWVEYGIYESESGFKAGKSVAHHPLAAASDSTCLSLENAQSRTHKDFKEFLYIPSQVLRLIGIALADNESYNNFSPSMGKLFAMISFYYNEHGDDSYSQKDDGSMILDTGLKSFSESSILLKCEASSDPRTDWKCVGVLVGERPFDSIYSIAYFPWNSIEEDIAELLPSAEELPQETLLMQIERASFPHSEKLIWLKRGLECEPIVADELFIPTGLYIEDGSIKKELYLCCNRNADSRQGWIYKTVVYEDAPLECYPRRSWLLSWATLNNDKQGMDEVLAKLKKQTLEEPWGFRGGDDCSILKNYLTYTFVKQYLSGAISYSSDKHYAAFNTGLPDRTRLEYIYALFERDSTLREGLHPLHHQHEYKLVAFTRLGAREG
ncbi:MAG: DUF3825 domain-containing protein, partial [Eggerthellaceae bacterium]|nr:DUF3825 domain-containing protein [Eggerthellaceae bacterium]